MDTVLTQQIFRRLFSSGVELANFRDVPHQERFLVIPGSKDPRWIVPRNSLLGWRVLRQWRPYGIFSRIKWAVILAAYWTGRLDMVPGVAPIGVNGALNVDWKHMGWQPETSLSPVIYIGTPGLQQKAVVVLVDSGSGEPLGVMKVALGEDACASLLREARTLQLLAKAGVKNVPVLLASEEAGRRAWQTAVPGKPTSRKLTELHVDWLLQLPRTGKTTTLDNQKQILCQLVEDRCSGLSARYLRAVTNAVEHIDGHSPIPLVLVHGDFAPWNVKLQSHSKLAVIDWEDAEFAGLPLWDLCHFHCIQSHLFNDNNLLGRFCTSRLVSKYLQALGINKKEQLSLLLLYLLFMITSKSRNISYEYRTFLVDQVPMVLEQ